MSLLLEALKKAELAKQAAKEQQPASAEPPLTRDKLPDISQPMEIRSEDLSLAEPAPAPKPAEKPVLELALEEAPRAAPPPPPPPPPRAAPMEEPEFIAPSESMERKQAQQLFEAKELDVNPRKPFYITLGALGLFALGTVGYFWYEMQPKNNYNIPPPSAQPAAAPLAVAPPAAPAPAAEPAASTVAPPAGSQPPAPGPLVAAPAAAPPVAAPAVAPAEKRAAPLLRQGAAEPAPRRDRDIKITPARVEADPVLLGAYDAYNAGDLERARQGYQQALRNSPDNRDALLGLAAIETQYKRYQAAERHYTRLLELDPRDAYAHAAMMSLRGQVDPVSAESRLKTMIAAQPEANFLNFTLGNQYAAQGRWAEAQQAYFRAYRGEPEHPDFAYNLAVSLDRMHQPKPALEYYRRALELARAHPVSFDKEQVSKRVSQLAR